MQRFETLLGTERHPRLRMAHILMTAGLYAVFLLIEWYLVHIGRVDARAAAGTTALVASGVGVFAVAVRSGWSARFRDPALTMPQILFALAVISISYLANASVRGATLVIVALVLVFGAFTLSPPRCRLVGWIAVGMLGAAMVFGAWHFPTVFARDIESIHFLVALIVLPTIAFLAGQLSQVRLDQGEQRDQLRVVVERLEALALHDDMTGLPNRRHVQEWIVHERARNRRSGASLCVAILDLDHFKRVNDTLGHAVGDEVLRLFARGAKSTLRDCDVLARWGGEEFLLVLPDTSLVAGRLALERLRAHMAKASTWHELPAGQVTFSAGLTLMEAEHTLDESVQRADNALYEAKRAGRDRVVVSFPANRATTSIIAS